MAGNDVRVRLTPEGIAEVTAALKKVQAEARKVSRESAGGVDNLKKRIGGLRAVVGGLGIGAASLGIAGLGRSALKFADQIDEAAQRTGASTETLSSLAVAAKFAGTTFETVEKTLLRLPQTLDALQSGSASAARTFAELQLTAADFVGLSLEQSLELIATRISAFEDPTKRAQLAVDVFGKSGGQLIPLLQDLAENGLVGVTARAEEMGVVVTAEMAAAAGATFDAVDTMGLGLQGLSNQFLQGFLPSVLTALNGVNESLENDGQGGLRDLGESAGRFLRVVVAVFTGVIEAARDAFRIVKNVGVGTWEAIGLAASGNLVAAGRRQLETFRAIATDAQRFADNAGKNVDAVSDALTSAPDAVTPPNRRGGSGEEVPDPAQTQRDAAAAEAARLAAVRQSLADEAAIRNAAAARQAAADQRDFDRGLIGLGEYIARRRAAIQSGLAAETGALRAQLTELNQQTASDAASRAADAASLRAQIVAAEIAAAQELDALEAERIDRQVDGARTRLEIEGQIAELEGRKADAARIALDLQAQALRQQLTLAGATRAQVDATVGRFIAASQARQSFEDQLAAAEAAFASLDTARARVEQDVQLGISTQLGGQTRILEIERARLPVLQSIVAGLQAAAQASGDPAAIAQAEALGLRMREVAISVDLASNSFARFRDQAEQSAVTALTDFLDQGIAQAKSLKDAVRQMALSVISDLKRIAAQALATSIVRGLSSAFGGGAGGGGGGGGGAGGFAAGGLLRGAGTGTSDSIPAWLSHGEYVVRASSVRRPGMLQMLERINAGDVPRFAGGGLVDIMPRFAGGGVVETGGSGSFSGRLEIGLADGLVPRSTPVSDQLIIDVIRRNPRRIGELIR